MQLTFWGHATVGIRIGAASLVADPVLRGHVGFLRRTAPPPDLDRLLDVDAVLVSHLHHDHCDIPSLTSLGRGRTLVVPHGSVPFFRRHGFTDVVPMRPGETCTVGDVAVTATGAAHDGRREPFGPRALALGFVVTADGLRLYFAGDTDLFPGMRDLAPDLDVALLPVAGWGRRLGPGHLDPIRAAEATRLLQPSLAVPIHWGGLRPLWHRPLADDRSAVPAVKFAAEVRRRALPTDVTVIPPGGSLVWKRPGEPVQQDGR